MKLFNEPETEEELYQAAIRVPPRIARWCCEIYKEHGGDGLFKAIGVRGEESKRRKGLWKQIAKNKRERWSM